MQIPINGELHFALTALFVEPEVICSTGRTPDEFDEQGTGTGLYIVVAGIAVKMESRELDLDKNVWMSGNYFPGMGNHYFAQIDRIGSDDHPVCDDWVPFFLLYNRGYLNAFGWSFFGRYRSSRYEYQSTISYPVFMDPIPQCVDDITSKVGMTTFHVLFETFYRNLGFK
jgi:charged multivesicular body protein 7